MIDLDIAFRFELKIKINPKYNLPKFLCKNE